MCWRRLGTGSPVEVSSDIAGISADSATERQISPPPVGRSVGLTGRHGSKHSFRMDLRT